MRIQNKLLALIFCINSICSYGQNQLYALLTIDDVNVESTFISNCFIETDSHKIELNYKVGRFEISSSDYIFLNEMSPDKTVSLSFCYSAICPQQKLFLYEKDLEVKLLLQEYLLLRIFNFNNYPNVFKNNIGYGIEIISPFGSSVLPKKTKKIPRNKCLN